MFCECCGTKIEEGASFCHKCGAKVVYKDAANHPAEVLQTISDDKNINTMFQDDTESFRKFVDNYVRANTKFSSAEDLITNSKPWRFAWICMGILSVIGLVLGINSGLIVESVLIFGVFFGYAIAFIVSCIIRMK